jgi:hypothetical protein
VGNTVIYRSFNAPLPLAKTAAEVAALPLQEEIEQQIHSRIHAGVYS